MEKKTFTYVPWPTLAHILEGAGANLSFEMSYDNPDFTEPSPYAGVTFAVKDADGVMKSLFMEDEGKPYEESKAAKILEAAKGLNVITEKEVYVDAGKAVHYVAPLHLPEHPMFKATPATPVERAINLDSDLTIEVLFAFDDGMVFPVYIREKTGGMNAMSFSDFIKDILHDIQYDTVEFFEELSKNGFPCRVGKDEQTGTICSLYCSSAAGNNDTLSFYEEEIKEIPDKVVSIRLVELAEHVS